MYKTQTEEGVGAPDQFVPDDFTGDRIARADSRGRVTLGIEVSDKEFAVKVNARGQYVLTPVVIMPESQVWLFKNPEALASVQRGLRDAAGGRVAEMPSFAEFADRDVED